ncbi:MAG: MetQ/NlpA family ABC transporter substrate-binding protein [Bifidobacteriaceae bacterium]|jgi:D-methionine transport system substrate-binding protein|nr:MetQ/NlpA family ABC transporter substrate-binding protein [Bifidobacteriaceae bacterium]
MKKTALALALTAATGLLVSGCGSDTLKIGASPVPHAEILNFVKDNLAADAGLDFEVVEYQDYVLPNKALAEGDLDANYFQHEPYLLSQEDEFGYDFHALAGVHIEPLGVYSASHASFDELADGAKIGVSNDPANQARGLRLLEAAGAIKLKDTGGDPTISDLAEDSPHQVELIQVEPKLLAVNLPDFDFAVINGNYAIDAGLSPSADAIFLESGEDNPYTNFLVTTTADKDDERLKKLGELLRSPEVKEFIESRWSDGSVIAAF